MAAEQAIFTGFTQILCRHSAGTGRVGAAAHTVIVASLSWRESIVSSSNQSPPSAR